MKFKGLLIGAGVVVASLAIAPYFVGQHAQQNIEHYVKVFDEGQPGYKAEIVSYERNWFASTAVIAVAFDLGALSDVTDEEMPELATEMELQLQHGPLLTLDGFALGWQAWQLVSAGDDVREHLTWDADVPLYRQSGWVNLLGDAAFSDATPQLESTLADGEFSFSLSPYSGTGTYANQHLVYAGTAEALTVSAEEFAATMTGFKLAADATASLETMLKGALYQTNGYLEVAQTEVTAAGEPVFVMDDLVVKSAIEFVDDLLNFDLSYQIKQLEVSTTQASNIELAVSLRNLDRAASEAYLEAMKDMYTLEPEELEQRLSEFSDKYALTFLQAEPEIVLTRLNAEFEQGRMHGDGKVGIRGVTAVPQNPDDPTFWLRHAHADAFFEIDKPLFAWLLDSYARTTVTAQAFTQEATPEQLEANIEGYKTYLLESMIAQGLLRDTATSYQTEVKLEQGVLTLNGTSQPLIAP